MPDVISQGGDRETSRRPRRLAAAAVLAAVLAVVIVEHLPGRPAGPRSAPAGAVAPSAPPVAAGAAARPGEPGEPDGVVGQSVLRDGSLQLPVAGDRPAWFWPATGRSEPIGGLPVDRAGYLFIRVGGGWAVQPGPAARRGCGSCAGPPLPVYFLADRARSVTRVGTANQVAPAAAAGALWLTSYPAGADMATTAGTAREVSDAGVPLRPPFGIPAGYVIGRATVRGLLLAPVLQRPAGSADVLWNPASARAGRAFTGVIAAAAGEVAWAPACAALCLVHVLDLATGRDTVVRLPWGSTAVNAAFSPDGTLLALQVSFGSGGDGGALAMQLEVASVATGRLRVVPGTWVSSDALVGFGWPVGSGSLVAELSFTTKVQVAAWRPGAARIAVAVVGPANIPAALVVG